MKRFLNLLKLDFTLQKRYGFFYASIFVVLVWIAVLQVLPREFLPKALPFIIFADLGIIGFYFIAGQILMEKGEGTIYALNVTPVMYEEYWGAKVITLTILALFVSLAVILATAGFYFSLGMFLAGVMLTSAFALAVGFYAVCPYNSISSFILPSQLYILVINIPLIDYFGWFEHDIFYIIPTKACLILLKGIWQPIAAGEMIYSLLYLVFWIWLLATITRKRFAHYILAQKGE